MIDRDEISPTPTPLDEERLLPAAMVANLFGVSLRTLRNWEMAHLLAPVRLRGRRYYPASAVRALLQGGHQRYARVASTGSELGDRCDTGPSTLL